jgi:hypothetical protein
MVQSNREILLADLLADVTKSLAENADHFALAQRIWDAASAMTSYEDKVCREYLQWFEGNLDMLLNLGADRETIERFLRDKMVLIKTGCNDMEAVRVAQQRNALNYLQQA